MADPFTIGAAIIGTGLKIAGDIKASNAKEAAALREADNRRLQALEIERRSRINIRNLGIERKIAAGDIVGAAASSGFGVGGTGTLRSLEISAARFSQAEQILREEAQFSAKEARRGGKESELLAGDIRGARGLRTAGTILGGGVAIASAAGAGK